MTETSPYLSRVIAQGEAWLRGEAIHNRVDDECCPDFSCCMPELFIRDRGERLRTINEWRRAHGYPEEHDA